MRNFLGLVFLLSIMAVSSDSSAQYTVYKEVDGVEFSTRWVKEKWYKRKSPKVLSVRVANKNSYTVKYTLGIEIFQNGILIESSPENEYSLKAGAKSTGRLDGVMFKPERLSSKDIEAGNFVMELSGLEIEKTE